MVRLVENVAFHGAGRQIEPKNVTELSLGRMKRGSDARLIIAAAFIRKEDRTALVSYHGVFVTFQQRRRGVMRVRKALLNATAVVASAMPVAAFRFASNKGVK